MHEVDLPHRTAAPQPAPLDPITLWIGSGVGLVLGSFALAVVLLGS